MTANHFTINLDPDLLAAVGPWLPGSWAVPAIHAEELRRQGRRVPQPVQGHLLIDTGAQRTCISTQAAEILGLKPISKTQSYGAGGLHINDVVFARLIFRIDHDAGAPASPQATLLWDLRCQAVPKLEEHPGQLGVKAQGKSTSLIGLVGRDVLRHATLVYDGELGSVEVTFDPSWIRSATAD